MMKQKMVKALDADCLFKNQYKTVNELNAINWEKRTMLLKYAFNTIPFYNEEFSRAGISAKDLNDESIWSNIPILTKQKIIDNFDKICKPNLQDHEYKTSTTGGSTGKPIKVLHDLSFNDSILKERMLDWWGIKSDDNMGRIWRYESKKKNKLLDNIKLIIKKYVWTSKQIVIPLDASYLDEKSISSFLKNWNFVCPSILSGYVGAVHCVAEYIINNGLKVHNPKACWMTAAPVLLIQRNIIEKAFGAPVFDQYGSCEVNWLAAECKSHRGLHIFYDARHIEFVNKKNNICYPGEFGRILVTDFYNKVFPLIRYEIGDVGRSLSGTCECGINLPLMDAVKGRISDTIKLKNGTAISGEYLTTIFDEYTDIINSFQIKQLKDYSIVIKVVPRFKNERLEEVLNLVKEEFNSKIINSVPFEIMIVDEIKSDKGKSRFIISDIK